MNASIIGRLIWKEYRTQRAFWLCVAGMGIALQLLMSRMLQPAEQGALFMLAMGLAGCFAVGSGAMLFAAEREDGTVDLLRALPTSYGRLLAAKLGFALVATLAMLGVLWVAAMVVSPGFTPRSNSDVSTPVYVLAVGFAGIACLVTATFWSLLTRRVINAVCLAAATVCLIQLLTSMSWVGMSLTGAIFVAAIPLARQWLTGDSQPWPIWLPGERQSRPVVSLHESIDTLPSRNRQLRRLVWQEWLASKWTIAWIAVGSGALVMAGAVMAPCYETLVVATAPLVCGVWAFRREQEQAGFQFLSERGVPPLLVWLSKQIVWTTAAVILTAVLVLINIMAIQVAIQSLFGYSNLKSHPLSYLIEETRHAAYGGVVLSIPVYALLNSAIGQWMSVVLQRSAMAIFLGTLVAIVFSAWAWLCVVFHIPLLFALGPIVAGFWAATALRNRDWLLARINWFSWLRIGAVLVVSVVGMFGLTAAYRVYEIPISGPAFAAADILPASPAALRTAEIYRRAMDKLTPYHSVYRKPYYNDVEDWSKYISTGLPDDLAWLEKNQEAIALLLEASQREECALWPTDVSALAEWDRIGSQWNEAANLLAIHGKRLESQGDLGGALDVYAAMLRVSRHMENGAPFGLRVVAGFVSHRAYRAIEAWALAEGQDPDRIRHAMQLADAFNVDESRLADSVKLEYVLWADAIDRKSPVLWKRLAPYAGNMDALAFCIQWMPWERERAKRAMRATTNATLEDLRQVQILLKQPPGSGQRMTTGDSSSVPWIWSGDTPILRFGFWPYRDGSVVGDQLLAAQRTRETEIVYLALAAWKAEHEMFPSQLDQLVGPYLEALPVDRLSGRPLEYDPSGDQFHRMIR